MKDLNILMATLVAAMKAIKVNSLNRSLAEVDIAKVVVVATHAKAWISKAKIITPKY
jgi:hypothetical protein